jgi:transcriptional regulator with XRE-family HTH domain
MSLGEKIRSLRRRRGLTVQGLASACSLSKGFISQVENGRTSPSLGTLVELARVLGVSPALLVANGTPGSHVTRADLRESSGFLGSQAPQAVSLSDRPSRSLDLHTVEIPAGSLFSGQPLDEPCEQVAHVMAGWVRITTGTDPIDLGPGDTCHWDACSGATISNVGAEPARVLLAGLSANPHPGKDGQG